MRTLQDAVDVGGGAAELLGAVGAVGHQPALVDEGAAPEHCRHARFTDRRQEERAVGHGEEVRQHQQSAVLSRGQRGDRGGVVHGRRLHRHMERAARVLDGAQHQRRERRGGGIVDDEDTGQFWRDLRQHLQPFAGQRAVVIGEPSDVAAGMGEILDEALADGIGDDGEHDRDRRGAPAQLLHRGRADRKQDVGLERHEFVGKLRHARAVAAAITPIDLEAGVLLPAMAGERLDQDGASRLPDPVVGRSDREHAEPPRRIRLLRQR
ncbi:hypothetical protein ABIB00_002504 [Bradyrhizobium sp. LB14.3]